MSVPFEREVVVVYKSLPHYRVDFYDLLRRRLAEDGIGLRLLVGRPVGAEALKHDVGELPWAELVDNRALHIHGRVLVWQPVLGKLRSADLVIVEQASKALVNFPLMIWRRVGGPRLGFWGHGFNRDPATASRFSEWLKRSLLRSCDWWFAYTRSTAEYVQSCGMAANRVTTVQNAIDTRKLQHLQAELPPGFAASVKNELGLCSGNIGVFVGSLYEAKRLRFLIEACDEIRAAIPDFALLVIGDGPQRDLIEDAAASRPWIVALGALTGAELVRYASAGSLLLMPGLVGLVILDAFALRVPLVACDVDNHSPEIDYLEPGVNGVLVESGASSTAYARTVVEVLRDPVQMEVLRSGCSRSAAAFTVDAMVENFRLGILGCLK